MERPPKHLIKEHEIKAIRWKNKHGDRRNFPDLVWGGERWYFNPTRPGELSLRSRTKKNLENSNRKGISITLQDYLDFAKENGFTPEDAKRQYNKNQQKLKQLARRRTKTINGDHGHARNLGGVEHWRNLTLMYADDNIRKSDKPLTNAMYEEFQIPRNKQEAMAADFAGVPPTNARKLRAALVKGGYGLDPTRPSNGGGVKVRGVGFINTPAPKAKSAPKARAKAVFRDVIDTSTQMLNSGFAHPGDDNPFGGRTIDVDPLFSGATFRIP